MSTLLAPSAISVVQNDVLADFLTAAAGTTEAEIKIYGPKDQVSNNPAPPCIAWGPEGDETWKPGQRPGKPGAPSALWTRHIPIVFEIFGGLNPAATILEGSGPSTSLTDTDRTEALMANLVNAFHRRLSQHGYEVASGRWGQAKRTGDGMTYLLTVVLKLPLVREDNPTVHISHINPEPEITDGT
jgi:hypothetical protein